MDLHRKPDVTIPDGPRRPNFDRRPRRRRRHGGHRRNAGHRRLCRRELVYEGGFDASWNRNDTFSFGLGAGQVIQGWDQGVQGMKVGGRRRLTIPPDMGYGQFGAGGVIGPTRRSSSWSTCARWAEPRGRIHR